MKVHLKILRGRGHESLKSAAYQEEIDGINWFLDVVTNSGKLKVTSIILGGGGQKWA